MKTASHIYVGITKKKKDFLSTDFFLEKKIQNLINAKIKHVIYSLLFSV